MKEDFSQLLRNYRRRFPAEKTLVDRFIRLLELPDAFHRTCRPGHFTASALVMDPGLTRVLLVEHRKLGIWVQPGGHADGHKDLEEAARREVEEETGMTSCRCDGAILDLDIHPIPARPGEGPHDHYDVRFLFIADADQTLRISEESTDLRWIPLGEVRRFTEEESMSRMITKAFRVPRTMGKETSPLNQAAK